MKTVRLLPLVAFAALCLFTLKVAGLLFSGGYMLSGSMPAKAQDAKPAASESAAPASAKPGAKEHDVASADRAEPSPTRSPEGAESPAGKDPAKQPQAAAGKSPAAPQLPPTSAELAVLESLSKRRKVLEKRERELQLRENLLKAAEQRVDKRISQLKTIEARIQKEVKKQKQEKDKQFSGLVKMYSGMKSKHAAKIFNRLDGDVQIALAKRMKPRVMAAILAAMNTEAAQRLTLELANESRAVSNTDSSLPKIQGQ